MRAALPDSARFGRWGGEEFIAILPGIEGEGGDAHAIELDVTDIHSIRAAVAHAETEVGSIDILVNSAGTNFPKRYWCETDAETFAQVVAINLNGTHATTPPLGVGDHGLLKASAVATSAFDYTLNDAPSWLGTFDFARRRIVVDTSLMHCGEATTQTAEHRPDLLHGTYAGRRFGGAS